MCYARMPRPGPPEAVTKKAAAPMATPTPVRHILAINDDPEILKVYTELLTEEGYLVSVELMPPADLGDVHAIGPDLIVLDLVVRGQERGTDFLALLRGNPSTRSLPVLVCSADTQRLEELDAQLRAWDCDVLAKPFDIDVFAEAIRSGLAGDLSSGWSGTGVVAD